MATLAFVGRFIFCTALKAATHDLALARSLTTRYPASVADALENNLLYLGVDLAWGSSEDGGNETGVAAIRSGRVMDAGWAIGLVETVAWIDRIVGNAPAALLMIDAPLVICNPDKQRLCETEVGRRYGRWKVSANSTNLNSANKAGVSLLAALRATGWQYDFGGTADGGSRRVSECYPYCTIVGAAELGYSAERPTYKRRPKARGLVDSASAWRELRKQSFEELAARLNSVIDLTACPHTHCLLEPASLNDREYKHNEDLIDAVLSAWTGVLWDQGRCQVLGIDDPLREAWGPGVIVAPFRPEQFPHALQDG